MNTEDLLWEGLKRNWMLIGHSDAVIQIADYVSKHIDDFDVAAFGFFLAKLEPNYERIAPTAKGPTATSESAGVDNQTHGERPPQDHQS